MTSGASAVVAPFVPSTHVKVHCTWRTVCAVTGCWYAGVRKSAKDTRAALGSWTPHEASATPSNYWTKFTSGAWNCASWIHALTKVGVFELAHSLQLQCRSVQTVLLVSSSGVWLWTLRLCDTSEMMASASRHGVMSLKTWILRNTAVISSNVRNVYDIKFHMNI